MNKQETLEEAANKLFDSIFGQTMNIQWAKEKAIELAKWQAERMYSEEDMRKAFIEGHNVCRCVTDNTDEAKEYFEEWFKKFKKK